MSVLNDCWYNVVGITRKEDECLTDPAIPSDYNVSLSNLYLDELRGMNLRFVGDAVTELWETISNAYENAVITLQMDILAELLKTNKKKYDDFIGNIGSQRFKNSLTLDKDYAGALMYMNDIKGATFKLSAIGLILDQTQTFDIYIYNSLESTPLYTISVTSDTGKYKVNNLPTVIELPLSDDNYDNIEYYIVYSRGTMQPKDNQVSCGCGGVKWCFNTKYPCFGDAKLTKDRWRQYAMVGGIQGDDLTDFESWYVSSYMNGLVLIGQFTCDNFIYFCNDNSDFVNNDTDKAIAFALQYKWGEYVMDNFLDTKEVSMFTALGHEAINNCREFYNSRYTTMINFVTDNIDIGRFGCLQCKSPHNATMRHQLL